MQKRTSPAQAARRVLIAFPRGNTDDEISSVHLSEWFRSHHFAADDMVCGVQFALSAGWVERTERQSLRLTEKGNKALDGRTETVSPSAWHSWAYR
jgi:hypothetical protein